VSRSPQDRIRDIRAAVAAIRQFEQAGRDEPMVFDAIRMRLLEIGEAANGIAPEIRESEPTVPWREIIGMRNWMAHRYFNTVHAYVWATVDHDLDPLLSALDRMAERLGPATTTEPG
jgi:uncharacterized protein with HEPN domain